MPLITAAIGLSTPPMEHPVDARWTMAYSASLDDCDAHYLDTTRVDGIVAHPLFAICPEWPVALALRGLLRERGLTAAEFRRNVHATHDSHLLRLIRPGDVLSTRATVLGMEMRQPGAYVSSCFESLDQHGELVCRTFNGMLFRDVEIMSVNKGPVPGLATGIEVPPTPHVAASAAQTPDTTMDLPIAANLGHIYTECARIWNPIHTDEAVAREAGLPHIILHGSMTLALAVSAIVRTYAADDPHRVTRICAQFRGMVMMPSTLQLRCFAPVPCGADSVVPFEISDPAGKAVIRNGSVTLAANA